MRRTVITVLTVVVLLAGTAAAHAATRRFPDFSDISTLTLSGNAQQAQTADGWVLRLTGAKPNQAGTAFGTATISAAEFSATFAFRLSEPNGTEPDHNGRVGADGITFAIQPVSASLGGNGGGLGIMKVSPSVAIEFDTYKNTDHQDPNSNHIGIDINGNVTSVATVDIEPNFNDGNVWHVWVDCDGALLSVAVSQTDVRPDTPQLSYAINVQETLGTEFAYVGFTAATGGGFQNQDILSWTYLDHYVPPANDAGVDDDGGGAGGDDGTPTGGGGDDGNGGAPGSGASAGASGAAGSAGSGGAGARNGDDGCGCHVGGEPTRVPATAGIAAVLALFFASVMRPGARSRRTASRRARQR